MWKTGKLPMRPAVSSTSIKAHLKEIFFVGFLVIAISALAIAATFWPRQLAGAVRVSLHGNEVTVLRLDVPTRYELYTNHGVVEIEVKDNKAAIVSSPCANQLCVKEGFKSAAGEAIVCAPEEVVLTFLGEGEISEVIL